jgi:hypothetical protein
MYILCLCQFFFGCFSLFMYMKNIYTLECGSISTLIYPYILGHLAPHVIPDIPFQNFSK